MSFLMRTLIIGVAVAVAAWLVPGITLTADQTAEKLGTIAAVALIIGLVNAAVRPVVELLSACLILVTLGLFLVVVNAWMLMLSAWVAGHFGLGFTVDGFTPALLGGLVISAVSMLLTGIVSERPRA